MTSAHDDRIRGRSKDPTMPNEPTPRQIAELQDDLHSYSKVCGCPLCKARLDRMLNALPALLAVAKRVDAGREGEKGPCPTCGRLTDNGGDCPTCKRAWEGFARHEALKAHPPARKEAREEIGYALERIITRRLFEQKIDGYTLEMSREQADAILALPSLQPPVSVGAGWRPIESAPRGGTFIWVFSPDTNRRALAAWQGRDDDAQWYGVDDMGRTFASKKYHEEPTMWMPLPAPPSDGVKP